jgi:hypothetical protein
MTLQRRVLSDVSEGAAPPLVHDVLRSPGQSLDRDTRSFMEARFGHDFSQVRVHADGKAAESARAVGAAAYTVGQHVVFGAGRHEPETATGRELLAHELTHVVQQERSAAPPWSAGMESIPGGGHSLRILPPVGESGGAFERAAESAADWVTQTPVPRVEKTHSLHLSSPTLQRVELPTPMPICGALVTDIDVLPPRPRALVECGLPPSVMVTRVNIVGRQRTPASTGRGRIIFNLHVGYYRDPATNRLCAVASDSELCLTPAGCIHIGCFPTLEEILDAIWNFVKSLLEILGIIILAIIAALILRGLRFPPGEGIPVPGEVPVVAEGSGEEQPSSVEA